MSVAVLGGRDPVLNLLISWRFLKALKELWKMVSLPLQGFFHRVTDNCMIPIMKTLDADSFLRSAAK